MNIMERKVAIQASNILYKIEQYEFVADYFKTVLPNNIYTDDCCRNEVVDNIINNAINSINQEISKLETKLENL